MAEIQQTVALSPVDARSEMIQRMEQRAWPHRYEVTIESKNGTRTGYVVATWCGVEKAKEIALAAGGRSESTDSPVTAESLGPVARADSGVAQPAATDLIDRHEW